MFGSGPARAADPGTGGLVGRSTCDKVFRSSHSGSYEDFEKDPETFQLGWIVAAKKNYVLVVQKESREENWCGKIIAAMEVELPVDSEHGEAFGFNCAVLDQSYDRHKSYLGVYDMNSLEYTRAKAAWVFDFSSLKFEQYAKPENVYCANFIAD